MPIKLFETTQRKDFQKLQTKNTKSTNPSFEIAIASS
jgi:hypothetical protein